MTLAASVIFLSALLPLSQDTPLPKIDRQAVVSRHNVVRTAFEGERPLQVGNGEFAFGMDATGLQTFAPFNTMSQWGWHSLPLPSDVKLSDYQKQIVMTHGRPVPYPLFDPAHPQISEWLAGNPHRINLGRLGLQIRKSNGSLAQESDLRNVHQELDLWSGVVTSRFEIEGQPITVTTASHPSQDAVAVKVISPLVEQGRISLFLSCPGDDGRQFANYVGDWNHPDTFDKVGSNDSNSARFIRRLGADSYHVSLTWSGDARLSRPGPAVAPKLEIVRAEYGAKDHLLDLTEKLRGLVKGGSLLVHVDNNLAADPVVGVVKQLRVTYTVEGVTKTLTAQENDDLRLGPPADDHRFVLQPGSAGDTLSAVCQFSPRPPNQEPTADETIEESRRAWPKYWNSGGAIDLSASSDPRWFELERRIVLSQYLMKVNEAGSLPPQESGLVNNGWFGRFHLEMTWWHATHWALWNRWPELNRGLTLYKRILSLAKNRAKEEGYLGARWPKCIGPDGREWPFPIHSFLIWQQPHPIFFAELDYRAHPTKETLKKWQPIVEATADFLASYAYYDEPTRRYVLGPPLHLVSENTQPMETMNSTFELGYWRFGLRTASEWRTRLGLTQNPVWAKVLAGLSPLPVQDGRYVLYQGVKDMWTKFNFEHPALTGTYGLLPGDGVDLQTMRRTLDQIVATWRFERTWGWDYPMLAMCAARLGEPDRAIDFLLTSAPGFQFDDLGLATGGPYPYFPSNGGLLYAVAMLTAGWDGAPKTPAPGFPKNGKWTVRSEGLIAAP